MLKLLQLQVAITGGNEFSGCWLQFLITLSMRSPYERHNSWKTVTSMTCEKARVLKALTDEQVLGQR